MLLALGKFFASIGREILVAVGIWVVEVVLGEARDRWEKRKKWWRR